MVVGKRDADDRDADEVIATVNRAALEALNAGRYQDAFVLTLAEFDLRRQTCTGDKEWLNLFNVHFQLAWCARKAGRLDQSACLAARGAHMVESALRTMWVPPALRMLEQLAFAVDARRDEEASRAVHLFQWLIACRTDPANAHRYGAVQDANGHPSTEDQAAAVELLSGPESVRSFWREIDRFTHACETRLGSDLAAIYGLP